MNFRWMNKLILRVSEEPDGCWFWTGPTNAGTPRTYWMKTSAHPVTMLAFLDKGLVRGGTPYPNCGERLCVNPTHYDWVEHGEYLRRWHASRAAVRDFARLWETMNREQRRDAMKAIGSNPSSL